MARRYVEPPSPRCKTIDIGAGDPDRFAPPKASVIFSPDGKRLYGVQNRPACRVLRYAAEAATAAANASADERQARKPGGRRHDAFLLYLEGLRRSEREHGLSSLRYSSTSPARGVYKARLGGSEGVAACLLWPTTLQGGEDEEGGISPPHRRRCPVVSPGISPERPSSAPPATGLDLWSQPVCGTVSPRFRARMLFEQRRAVSPDMDAVKRSGYLVRHQQKKLTQAAKEAKEADLLRVWPHGLPASELRHARASGLRVAGLGAGGNPLSLPHRTYLALRQGMKWYSSTTSF